MQIDTRAENHGLADAVAVRERPHHQAAEGAAEPGQRACERRPRARAAEIGGDRLQADRHDPQRAERDREHTSDTLATTQEVRVSMLGIDNVRSRQ